MIADYIRPQLVLRQLLETLPDIGDPSMNAFVYGPQFKLNRYTSDAERKEMSGAAYQAGATIPYEGVESGANVDLEFVRLYGENLDLALATFEADAVGGRFFYNDYGRPNEIVLKDESTATGLNAGDADEALHVNLNNRAVQAGDIAIVTDGVNTVRRTVKAIRRLPEDSSYSGLTCQTVDESVSSNDIDVSGYSSYHNSGSFPLSTSPMVDSATTKAAFAAAGASYGGAFAERFTVTGIELLNSSNSSENNKGAVLVRSSSGAFDGEVPAYIHSGTGELVIEITGASLEVSGTDIQFFAQGDTISWTTVQEYTPISCEEVSGGNFGSDNLEVVGQYSHDADTTIVLECVAGGAAADAEWQFSDTQGLESTITVSGTALEAGASFGTTGLTFTISNLHEGLHRKGDLISVDCVAASNSGEASIVVLNAPAGDPSKHSNLDGSP
ncbi:MAG: hypothetical protein EB168_08645, partial [Euryarchaeota archaeon]|nr:hypothetical protein [Euryarchaeota archaeon]